MFLTKFPKLFQITKCNSSYNTEVINKIYPHLNYTYLNKNNVLFRAFDKADRLYFLIKGKLSIIVKKEKLVYMNEYEYLEYLIHLKEINENSLINKVISLNMKTYPLDFDNFDELLSELYTIATYTNKNNYLFYSFMYNLPIYYDIKEKICSIFKIIKKSYVYVKTKTKNFDKRSTLIRSESKKTVDLRKMSRKKHVINLNIDSNCNKLSNITGSKYPNMFNYNNIDIEYVNNKLASEKKDIEKYVTNNQDNNINVKEGCIYDFKLDNNSSKVLKFNNLNKVSNKYIKDSNNKEHIDLYNIIYDKLYNKETTHNKNLTIQNNKINIMNKSKCKKSNKNLLLESQNIDNIDYKKTARKRSNFFEKLKQKIKKNNSIIYVNNKFADDVINTKDILHSSSNNNAEYPKTVSNIKKVSNLNAKNLGYITKSITNISSNNDSFKHSSCNNLISLKFNNDKENLFDFCNKDDIKSKKYSCIKTNNNGYSLQHNLNNFKSKILKETYLEKKKSFDKIINNFYTNKNLNNREDLPIDDNGNLNKKNNKENIQNMILQNFSLTSNGFLDTIKNSMIKILNKYADLDYIYSINELSKKQVIIFEYYKVNELTDLSVFGDLGMLDPELQRTATVITEEDCHLCYINYDEYRKNLKDFFDRSNKRNIAFINDIGLFNKFIIKNYHLVHNYFIFKEHNIKDIIYDSLNNTEINNTKNNLNTDNFNLKEEKSCNTLAITDKSAIYIVKEGSYKISLNTNLKKLDNIIKILFKNNKSEFNNLDSKLYVLLMFIYI